METDQTERELYQRAINPLILGILLLAFGSISIYYTISKIGIVIFAIGLIISLYATIRVFEWMAFKLI